MSNDEGVTYEQLPDKRWSASENGKKGFGATKEEALANLRKLQGR